MVGLIVKRLARALVPNWLRTKRAVRFRSRVAVATRRLYHQCDGIVIAGPFAGMRYVGGAHSSQLGPKLLGTYEAELSQILGGAGVYDRVIDVGAAEGYYAVGLLRYHSELRVIAFEESAAARAALSRLARLNGVTERLDVRGFCDHEELNTALAMPGSSMLIVDVDGGEGALIDPDRVPGLRTAPILVELHPHELPGIRRTITERFASTHEVAHISSVSRSRGDVPNVSGLSPSDVVYAAWEARPDDQGWLWMVPRVNGSAAALQMP